MRTSTNPPASTVLPPHDAEAEAGALGCVLSDAEQASECLDQLSKDDFYDERHRQVYAALRCLSTDKQPLTTVALHQWLKKNRSLTEAGGTAYVSALPEQTPSPANFPTYLAELKDLSARRAAIRDAAELERLAMDTSITPAALADAARRMMEAHSSAPLISLQEKLSERRFNPNVKPPEQTPRYWIGKAQICTRGNLTALSAPPKAAKSSFLSAMLAAVITPCPTDADCLGVTSRNPDGEAVIHFDTEQSIADHHAGQCLTLRRAILTEPPPWLLSYCATGFTITEARACVPLIMKLAAKEFGGIHSVLLDGVADLVRDVNDAEECNVFVNELHSLAITFDCPIVGVIHLNPGTDKTRGHLGSQLERKAETNLRLERDGDAFIVWSEKNRRAPILKSNGPRFTWSDEHKMHVSTQSAADAKEKSDTAILRGEAEAVFTRSGKPSLHWGDFITLLAKETKRSESGARKRMEKMVGAQILSRDVLKLYRLAQ